MNTLDLIILLPVAAGFITGLFRGLIKEVISLAVIIIGIYAARLLSPIATTLMIDWFEISPKGAQVLGFVAIFSLVAILLTIAGRLLQGVIQLLTLGFLNAIVGGVFGGLKIVLLFSIFFNVVQAIDHKVSIIDTELREESLLYSPVKGFAPGLWEEIIEKKDKDAEITTHKRSA